MIASRVAAVLFAIACCAGCDGGREMPPGLPDAGSGNDAPSGLVVPAPEPPAPPVLTPCPLDWNEGDLRGVTICEPPDRATTTCPEGQVRFAGDTVCAPIGRACPVADWPEPAALPAATQTLYVRPGAGSGTGTRSQPFGTIADAMRAALPGALVVLARGTYAERVDFHAGVTVLGACAAETIIAPSIPDIAAFAVAFDERDGALEDVTVAPTGTGGIVVRASARLESVVVEGADPIGIAVSRAALDATAIVVRTTNDSRVLDFGRALTAEGAATVEVDRAILEGSAGDAISASDTATSVHLTRALVRGNGHQGELTRAFNVQDGARLAFGESVIEENHGALAVVLEESSALELVDVVVRNGLAPTAGTGHAMGVIASRGARIDLRRTRMDRTGSSALAVIGGSTLAIEDVVVSGVGAGGSDLGIALGIGAGSSMDGARLLVSDSFMGGLTAAGAGEGVVEDMPASVHVTDVRIAGTARETHAPGFPIALDKRVTGSLSRVRIEQSAGAGILIGAVGTDIELTDLAVVDTEGRSDGSFGRGLEVQLGAVARVSRALFERSREVSVMSIGGSQLSLDGVRIVETLARDCAETTCADAPGGSAIGAYDGATLTAANVVVQTARLCGLQIASDGAIDLRAAEISGASIGACVQVPAYDLDRITRDVLYHDNGINLDSPDLAVPEAIPGPPAL